MTLPHVLLGVQGFNGTGYDDGVSLGASLGLISGHVPYRDFVLPHPPGLPLLMIPVALLGKVTGMQSALVTARVLTALVTGLNGTLAALCVRHRGSGAMLLAGVLLACWPLAPSADRTLMPEPYVVLLSLLAVLAMFSGGEVARPRRLLLAGAALGFATSVSILAIVVAAVAAAVCLRYRAAVLAFGAGFATGILVPCLPFLGLAPAGFLRQVFTSREKPLAPVGGWYSTVIDGHPAFAGSTVNNVDPGVSGWAVVLLIAVLIATAIVFRMRFRSMTRFDAMTGACCLAIAAVLFSERNPADRYTYLLAPFLAITVATASAISTQPGPTESRRSMRLGLIPAVFAVVLAMGMVPMQMSYAKRYLADSKDTADQLQAAIPAGSCVLLDQATTGIAADRFSSSATCPFVVDPYGTWVDRFPLHPPPYSGADLSPDLTALWKLWMTQADYVVQAWPPSTLIAWTPDLHTWFVHNYRAVHQEPGISIFKRVTPAPATGGVSTP
jgi:hypothetical protein